MSAQDQREMLRASRLPDAEAGAETMIRQVYWDLGGGWCLRLRREGPPGVDPRDSLAVKGPRGGMARPEWEWWLRPEQNEPVEKERKQDVAALYKVSGRQVVKTRRSYLLDGQTWDVDEFHWANKGLIIAELELPDVRVLRRVRRPPWCVRETTDDRRYDNENLAFRPFTTWK